MAEKSKPGTAMTSWDEELAAQAEIAAELESGGGPQSFSLQGGIISWAGVPVVGNQLAVIILASRYEYLYFPEAFDPDNSQPPACFAFAEAQGSLAPHPLVVEAGQAQHETCAGCPMNEFGSDPMRGRGKACKNVRRLTLISAGEFDKQGRFLPYEEPEQYAESPLGAFRVPTMSMKGYSAFVVSAKASLGRPPYSIFTSITTVPDPKTQFKVVFKALGKVPDTLRQVVEARKAEAESIIETPYQLREPEEEAPPPPAKKVGKQAAKPQPAAKARTTRKY